jgi:hypothetical protein
LHFSTFNLYKLHYKEGKERKGGEKVGITRMLPGQQTEKREKREKERGVRQG